MSCFVVSIQKQAFISGTVKTGQQYFLGCPALCHSTVDSSFDVKQSKLLQVWTSHSESFLTVLCWCLSFPFLKVVPVCQYKQAAHSCNTSRVQ